MIISKTIISKTHKIAFVGVWRFGTFFSLWKCYQEPVCSCQKINTTINLLLYPYQLIFNQINLYQALKQSCHYWTQFFFPFTKKSSFFSYPAVELPSDTINSNVEGKCEMYNESILSPSVRVKERFMYKNCRKYIMNIHKHLDHSKPTHENIHIFHIHW